jgi:hypothetical protein
MSFCLNVGWGFWLFERRQTNIEGICIQIKLFFGITAMRSVPYTPPHVIARPWYQIDSQLD